MKIIKLLILLLLPIFIFANNIEYRTIDNISMKKEDNLTRIMQINNETFEYFKIYMDNETAKKLTKDCKVKFKDKYFSLSNDK
jgi:cellobiose-specific phosphotransferase system component IIC